MWTEEAVLCLVLRSVGSVALMPLLQDTDLGEPGTVVGIILKGLVFSDEMDDVTS